MQIHFKTRENLVKGLAMRREACRRAARLDVNHFIEEVLKDARGRRVVQAPIHRHWHEHVDRCFMHGRMCGILAPWGHGKTEQVVIARALRMIGEDPSVRIKIVCNSDENAQARVAAIGRYITGDADFRAVYPHVLPAAGQPWSRHSLTVERRSASKDPTLEAYGVLAGGIGGRCDVLIADDPVDLRNAVTMPALRKQVVEAFRNVWLSRLEPDGRVIYIATRWHMDDLTGHLMDSDEFRILEMRIADDFSCIEYSETSSGTGKETGRLPLWEARWSEAALRTRCSQLGQRAFDRGFRQKALCDEELLFTRAMIEGCFDYSLTARDLEPDNWATYVGVDLAGVSRRGNVIFVLGLMPDGTRVPLEVCRGHWNSPQTAQEILRINRRWRPQVIAVENNAYQQSLLDWMWQMGARDVPVRPFTTTAAKSDPRIGIPSLAVEFANRAWRIPMGLARHDQDCDCWTCSWIEEMTTYPLGRSTDILMASWFAREAARAASGGSIHFNRLPDLL